MIQTSLHDWFTSPLGAYLLEREQAWLDKVVPDIFGYHAVQLGLPQFDLLRESRIVHKVTVNPDGAADVLAQWHELPFDAQSVDLCVMPHLLEFSSNPHEILREIDRIMRPEGRILILGFNPWSLFGTRRLFASKGYPWQGQFVSLVRMKDWLQLLGFEPSSGRLDCYIPPCETAVWQKRWRFMESMGDRWWGVGGGVYMLEAIKRVQGMRLIAPAWSDQKIPEREFATARRDHAARTSTQLRLVK
ncbi:MAG: methyltransferase domain-containing protein [Betaproteobacteria bacterium]